MSNRIILQLELSVTSNIYYKKEKYLLMILKSINAFLFYLEDGNMKIIHRK
ncbi:hypothetical protein CLOSBL3_10904 [Clostridiaceae bacterium BL-3]|nr:hypothetical protein CLOSBL3_10904 [Clostridiaceae bacterium BL-3]